MTAPETERARIHLEIAQHKYEALRTGHLTGHIHLWHTPGGVIDEPFDIVFFEPLKGERTGAVDTIDPNPEFQMFWSWVPDFRLAEYDIVPTEAGWVAKMVYRGTARDGTEVVAHQIEWATTDERSRVRRVERYREGEEWWRLWSVVSGKSIEDVKRILGGGGGLDELMRDRLEAEQAD